MPVTSPDGIFPLTRHSVALAAQSDDPAARSPAIETFSAAYRRPIYKFARMKWKINSEDASDFTQEFFAHLLGGGLPAHARRLYFRDVR